MASEVLAVGFWAFLIGAFGWWWVRDWLADRKARQAICTHLRVERARPKVATLDGWQERARAMKAQDAGVWEPVTTGWLDGIDIDIIDQLEADPVMLQTARELTRLRHFDREQWAA